MAEFKVVVIFESINGEGQRAGQLAVFVRLAGCNLNCSYCDTKWANKADVSYVVMTEKEIYSRVRKTNIKNVTITGGEPLFRSGAKELLELLCGDRFLRVEIETNGSVDLGPFVQIKNRPSFTMDYKLISSGMEDKMFIKNFDVLNKNDTVKFVSGSIEDLKRAKDVIEKYNLTQKCGVYISPVFGQIEPAEIVEFMKENLMNDVNLQIQMHKVIWDPDKRGV